jgi:hypothetical protein
VGLRGGRLTGWLNRVSQKIHCEQRLVEHFRQINLLDITIFNLEQPVSHCIPEQSRGRRLVQ